MVTALPYAKEDMFGFVLYFNVRFNEHDNEILQKTARELSDLAHQTGGTYYLPYQLFNSKEQLKAVYRKLRSSSRPRRNMTRQNCLPTNFMKSMRWEHSEPRRRECDCTNLAWVDEGGGCGWL